MISPIELAPIIVPKRTRSAGFLRSFNAFIPAMVGSIDTQPKARHMPIPTYGPILRWET